MPETTNSKLDKILSDYEKAARHNTSKYPLTGAEFYTGISDKPFDTLSAGERLIYNLIVEATNEALAEYEKDGLCEEFY